MYLTIQDLHKKIDKLETDIRNKVKREKTEFDKNSIFVETNVINKGEVVKISNPSIKGVVLSTKSPEIYHDVSGGSGYTFIRYCIVLYVESMEYLPDTIKLMEKEYQFYTYEEFLKFFTRRYIEDKLPQNDEISIHGTIKEVEFSLAYALVNHPYKVETHECLINEDFTILYRYRSLPEEVKKEVDSFICPLVVQTKDVSIDTRMSRIFIRLDKKDMLKDKLCTNKFTEELKSLSVKNIS